MHFILYNYINVNPQIWLLASCIIMHLGRRLSRRRRGDVANSGHRISIYCNATFLEREMRENFFNFDIPAATSGLEYFAILSQPTSIFLCLIASFIRLAGARAGCKGGGLYYPQGKDIIDGKYWEGGIRAVV